jgi:hypothetical protein
MPRTGHLLRSPREKSRHSPASFSGVLGPGEMHTMSSAPDPARSRIGRVVVLSDLGAFPEHLEGRLPTTLKVKESKYQ